LPFVAYKSGIVRPLMLWDAPRGDSNCRGQPIGGALDLIIGADFLRSPGDLNRFNFRIYLH
jgi:hypothetical protein